MELSWQQQVAIFECRYPRYSRDLGSPGGIGYSAGFQLPNGRRAAASTLALVWIELYRPLPPGRFDRN